MVKWLESDPIYHTDIATNDLHKYAKRMFVFDALNHRKQINGTNGMVDSQPMNK